MATWYEATKPYPALNILPGDLVRYEPGQEWPIEITRCVGACRAHSFWFAVVAGALKPVCDAVQVADLAAQPAPDLPAPADVASRRRAMRVVRAS